jgi:hypothetical protein
MTRFVDLGNLTALPAAPDARANYMPKLGLLEFGVALRDRAG